MVDFTVYKGSKEGKIVKSTTSKQVAPDEVLLRVQFSGLCSTDIHFKSVDMALGHEGVGIVEQLGKDVKTLKM
jgi:D-arabinose 1-dehydrogenase-like Zn-dependent alcohol dehydrogenase